MMILLPIFLSLVGFSQAEKHFYHTFSGSIITEKECQQYVKAGTKPFCVIEIEDCDVNEGRRLDETCNNLEHPTRGGTHTPFIRELPPNFYGEDEPRKAKSGSDLPSPRQISLSLLSVGRLPDTMFTNMVANFWLFLASDASNFQDTINLLYPDPPCCSDEGKDLNKCVQIPIPVDDSVHRFSDIRCFNMTKPLSFQNTGCIQNGTIYEAINGATPVMDLSSVYGSNLKDSLSKGRLFQGGLLKYEEEGGKTWPPSVKDSPKSLCSSNQEPQETRCHDTPYPTTNYQLGINLFSIWYWRQHNRLARELAKLNPCWDDEKLFSKARDINIALALQIYLYEMLPLLLGRDNLIRDGIISASSGHRDLYDENIIPQMSVEGLYVLRWVHTIQEGKLKLYDKNGDFVKYFPIVNATFRTGYLAVDNNIDYITQSFFRQSGGRIDHTVDPDLANIGFGPMQAAADVFTLDNYIGRYYGFQPYIKYRELCSGYSYKTFEQLVDVIDSGKIEQLKDLYEDVEDIELMAGIWLERPMEGSCVPPTFYCLFVKQLKRSIVMDRHWYERADRPSAFTFEQLQEIRKASVSRMVCQVGDAVTEIQPIAFLKPGPGNEIDNCNVTTKNIKMSTFRDPDCTD